MEVPPNPERFEQANRIFSDALALSAEERARFVSEQCVGDPTLGDSVLRLLSQFDRLGSFLDTPAAPQWNAQTSLAEGELLCERFRILGRIGAGGMGEVFRAEDRVLGEVVALKAIRGALRDDAAMLARFRQEIRLARKVSHANVCKIFDLFTHAPTDRPPIDFFTMQYLPGENLATRIGAAAPFPREEVLRIATGIAQGLDAAHAEGIIHRDLKPANVVLLAVPDTETRPVITDFGLARLFERDTGDSGQTVAGQILGTVDYMAPEQFEGAPPQPATDVYALAVIVFEMVTGEHPYPSESMVRAAMRRVTEPPASLRVAAPQLPLHWDRVIRKALARRPENRYASAGAMLGELDRPSRITAISLRLTPRPPSRRSLIAGGCLAAGVTTYFGISRFIEVRAPLPDAPLVMLNPLTHAPNDAIEAGALDLTLANQLAQSAHLQLLNRERVEHNWRTIQGVKADRAAPVAFEPRMAREIAMRSGAQLVVFGSFIRAGDQRTLTLQIERMGSSPDQPQGRPWLRHFDTSRPSDLADTGHEAAEWLRRTIGETEKELEGHNRPPEELTTPYWSALQEYVEANEAGPGKPDAAALHLTTALRIDPDFAQAAARLGDILRSEGQVDEALTYWSKAAQSLGRRNLTDRESLRIRGLFASDIGQAAESEQIFARYALEYPRDALPLFYRATALDHLGRYEEAERLHTLAIQREPLYSFVMGRATFYLSRGRLDEAEKDWRAGRDMNPFDWTDQIEMAIAFARGDRRRVEASLQHLKSTGSAQGHSRALVVEACLHAERNDCAAAEEILRGAIAFDRTMGLPLASQWEKQLLLAELLLAQRPAESVSIAAAALAGTPPGTALARQPAESVSIASTALAGKPGHCARMAFGAVLAQAGEVQAARNCLVTGLPDWPVYKIAQSRLEGEIAFAQRDFKNAIRLVRQAVQPPHMRTWPDFLLRAALAAGDSATAAETLDALFFAPGIYWLGAERNIPGFVRAAVTAAERSSDRARWAKQLEFFHDFRR